MSTVSLQGRVIAVSCDSKHHFSKQNQLAIRLVAGLGVEGDAHNGITVKHRSRVARDPTKPNLRQVHLIHAELFDELRDGGFTVHPGDMGENITTQGIDLLALPAGTRLQIGENAIVEITGLRNPCSQIDAFQPGLMKATLGKDADGNLIRKAGVMSIVVAGGEVHPGDGVTATVPVLPHRALEPV
ncbi:MAG TPA: MOSC domain-containing protein [Xanthobacteraceae bacterium]|jgi:MOSC domain-containing protein YiiM|nr:MOSC domain-containing protein [Xanthobacteraceae bacterium]